MEILPRLGVNIDHVATLRNARGENYPSPLRAAIDCEKFGADGITAHLREDRRHIIDQDIFDLKSALKVPLNFEMAATDEMFEIACSVMPNACCIVPEKREEVTTEGGIDVIKNSKRLGKYIHTLKDKGIRTSLFIDPSEKQIKEAKLINADIVEIHSGEYCRKLNYNKNTHEELSLITNASQFADQNNLEVHSGHGITFDSIVELSRIKEIKEFNIGHFIISESVYKGLENVIKRFKELIRQNRV